MKNKDKKNKKPLTSHIVTTVSEERKQEIERLRSILKKRIEKFKEKHSPVMYCFPDGKKSSKIKLKKIDGSVETFTCRFSMLNLYICAVNCRRKEKNKEQCEDFLRKKYLCRDLKCSNIEFCFNLKTEEDMLRKCKSLNMLSYRNKLDRIYESKFFRYMAMLAGLKNKPKRYTRIINEFLAEEAAKKETENGKVRSKEDQSRIDKKRREKRREDERRAEEEKTFRRKKVKRRKTH